MCALPAPAPPTAPPAAAPSAPADHPGAVSRPPVTARHPWSSRVLRTLGTASASTPAALVAAAVSAGFLLGALLSHHSAPWLTAFQSLAAAVTVVMVFALQHTAAREQSAVQRKLDELLAASPAADSRLLRLESAPAEHHDAVEDRHERLRAAAGRL